MKKLMVSVFALSVVAAVATAAPVFDLAPGADVIKFDPGQTLTIDLVGTGPTLPVGFQGMELYAALSGNFEVVDLLVDQAGSGTAWVGNTTGALIIVDDSKKAALGMVTTASGGLPTGSTVAKLIVKAIGNVGDVGSLTTDGMDFWGASSNFADGAAAGQDTVRLEIIPEPMTALLLLAAVPFMRRRTA